MHAGPLAARVAGQGAGATATTWTPGEPDEDGCGRGSRLSDRIVTGDQRRTVRVAHTGPQPRKTRAPARRRAAAVSAVASMNTAAIQA